MWTRGSIGEFNYSVKHFEEGSEFGINGGRISKLEIRRNGKTVVNYDRGWDIHPKEAETNNLYMAILNEYN